MGGNLERGGFIESHQLDAGGFSLEELAGLPFDHQGLAKQFTAGLEEEKVQEQRMKDRGLIRLTLLKLS